MSATIPVPYDELQEGLEEGYSQDQGVFARKVFLVNWQDRFAFAQAMAGTSSTPSPGGTWIRAIPYPYPDPTAGNALYAKSLSIVPEGDCVTPNSPIQWTKARITVTFGALTWDALPGDDPLGLNSFSQDPSENASLQFASQELRFSEEYYEIPNSCATYVSDGSPFNGPARGRTSIHHMVITWHRYPLIPMTLLRSYVDRVNQSTFLGCAQGTVMLEGVNTTRDMTSDGTITQKVQMNFKWRQNDWNAKPREDNGRWDPVLMGGTLLYPYSDFKGLLL